MCLLAVSFHREGDSGPQEHFRAACSFGYFHPVFVPVAENMCHLICFSLSVPSESAAIDVFPVKAFVLIFLFHFCSFLSFHTVC